MLFCESFRCCSGLSEGGYVSHSVEGVGVTVGVVVLYLLGGWRSAMG